MVLFVYVTFSFLMRRWFSSLNIFFWFFVCLASKKKKDNNNTHKPHEKYFIFWNFIKLWSKLVCVFACMCQFGLIVASTAPKNAFFWFRKKKNLCEYERKTNTYRYISYRVVLFLSLSFSRSFILFFNELFIFFDLSLTFFVKFLQ